MFFDSIKKKYLPDTASYLESGSCGLHGLLVESVEFHTAGLKCKVFSGPLEENGAQGIHIHVIFFLFLHENICCGTH